MVAILTEFIVYIIVISKIASANEVLEKENQNEFDETEKTEPSLLLSNNLYGKRVNYALMPLMGGMYGKRSFIPFPGGIYIKRRIGGYYNKRSFLPEGIQNKGPNFAEFNPPSAHYVGIGKVGPFPYEKWQQHQLEEDNNDFYKDDSNSLQTLPNTLRHIS